MRKASIAQVKAARFHRVTTLLSMVAGTFSMFIGEILSDITARGLLVLLLVVAIPSIITYAWCVVTNIVAEIIRGSRV